VSINLSVIHDYAFGGDEQEVVPVTRRALAQIHRELTAARKKSGAKDFDLPPLDVTPPPSR
jgi:hypothetical protein